MTIYPQADKSGFIMTTFYTGNKLSKRKNTKTYGFYTEFLQNLKSLPDISIYIALLFKPKIVSLRKWWETNLIPATFS